MFMFKGKLNFYKYAVNESFTIIFPTIFEIDEPVCAVWQWTVTSRGAKQENVASVEVISSVSRTKDEVRVGFTVGGYYHFEALVGPWLESLTVTMSDPSGPYKDPTVLSRIYPKERPLNKLPQYNGPIPEHLGCAIYTGKLNWFEYAVNELVTVIFMQDPGAPLQAGSPIYIAWQWTCDSTGKKKADATLFGELESASPHPDSSELKIEFLSNNYYKFEGLLNETGETMTLTMRNPAGDRSNNIILQLNYATFPSKRRREKRGFLNGTTSTVMNDTDEAVWCNLVQSSSATDRKNLELGLIGEGLAVIGAGLAIPAAQVPAAAGLAFALVGLTFSTLALVDGLRTPADPTRGLLFPGDNMTRTSTTLTLNTDNDLIITRIKVYPSLNAQAIQYGVKKELGKEKKEWKLSEVLSSTDFKFENLFTFYLPADTTYRMESCALIRIAGLKPNASDTPIPDQLQPNVKDAPSGAMFTTKFTKDPKESFTHGVWTTGTTSLSYDARRKFWFLESFYKNSTDRKVIHLPDSANVILQLHMCVIHDPPQGEAIGRCSHVSDALSAIQKKLKDDQKGGKVPCAAYMWYSGSNQDVIAYKKLKETSVIKSGEGYQRNYVWLHVETYNYFQRLANAE